MLAAGWHAHTLNAPGKFLVSAPEHTAPRRARAYLVTDEDVARTVARYANGRPELDDVSRDALLPDVRMNDDGWTVPGDAQSDAGEPGDAVDTDPSDERGRRALVRSVHCPRRWGRYRRAPAGQRHEPSHLVPAPRPARPGGAGDPGQPRTMAGDDYRGGSRCVIVSPDCLVSRLARVCTKTRGQAS
jgi:hypothetical protein